MGVFIVTVSRELEPEINQAAVLLAVHGSRSRGEEGRVRVYQHSDVNGDEKAAAIKACLCRVREYQSNEVAVAFANSWLFPTWDGIQVIGRISDGGDITFGVEELPPTLPLSPESVDISVPDADEQLPPFDPWWQGKAVQDIGTVRDEAELPVPSHPALVELWVEGEGTPVRVDPRRQSASPVEESHRLGKRPRDE